MMLLAESDYGNCNKFQFVYNYTFLCNSVCVNEICKGGGTGPAGPVLAGPLFQRASKTFEQTKKQMHGKQILILVTRT